MNNMNNMRVRNRHNNSHERFKDQSADISGSGNSPTERSMVRTTHLTSYVFGAPKPYKMAIGICVLAFLAGFFINLNVSDPAQNFEFGHVYRSAIVFGLMLLGLPALFSGMVSTPLAELLGGTFYQRRSFLLAFISVIVLVCTLFLSKLVGLWFELDFGVILIFAYAFLISVRYPVLLATSNHRLLNSLPSAINHTILGFVFICIIPQTGLQCSMDYFLVMILFTLIFLITTLLWLRIITTPFRRNFNVDGLLLMKLALTQFTSDNKTGLELEDEFFSKIGSPADLRVGVVGFRAKPNHADGKSLPGSARNKLSRSRLKTLIVIPSVHPGPFGILGGSNLPIKLSRSKYLKGLSSSLMVFHGPATHEQNLVATRECSRIARAINKMVKNLEFSSTVSAFRRQSVTGADKGSASTLNLNICTQRFGNGIVHIHTSAPEPTDDIDYPTGEAVIQRTERDGFEKALFIDAHNCLEPGTGVVFFGSMKARDMLRLVSKASRDMRTTEEYTLSAGFAEDRRFAVRDGIGPMGIQVLVTGCERADTMDTADTTPKNITNTTNAYVLLDGNNMVHGLRERLKNALARLVDEAEIFTTDNHVVNATMGGYNPVGLKVPQELIVRRVVDAVTAAKNDMEPCEVGVDSGIVRNIKVLGQNTPIRLSSTINSTISIMRTSLAACQAAAIAACWVVYIL